MNEIFRFIMIMINIALISVVSLFVLPYIFICVQMIVEIFVDLVKYTF